MSRAYGWNASLLIAEETEYGVLPENGYRQIPFISLSNHFCSLNSFKWNFLCKSFISCTNNTIYSPPPTNFMIFFSSLILRYLIIVFIADCTALYLPSSDNDAKQVIKYSLPSFL